MESSVSLSRPTMRIASTLMFVLASATRSNGILLLIPLFFATLRTCPLVSRLANKSQPPVSPVAVLAHWALGAVQAVCVLSPTLYLSYSAYVSYCVDAAARGLAPRPRCYNTVPSIYGYIQREYWGVGPFLYFQAKQIPNFALAVPALTMAACACLVGSPISPRW